MNSPHVTEILLKATDGSVVRLRDNGRAWFLTLGQVEQLVSDGQLRALREALRLLWADDPRPGQPSPPVDRGRVRHE